MGRGSGGAGDCGVRPGFRVDMNQNLVIVKMPKKSGGTGGGDGGQGGCERRIAVIVKMKNKVGGVRPDVGGGGGGPAVGVRVNMNQ